jgi:hypothetical protein
MFEKVLSDIEEVFASSVWKTNSIKTFPANYLGSKSNDGEYVILTIMPSKSENFVYGVQKQLSGLLAVKIFVKSGEGQGRTMAIANLLDIVLENKRLTLGTELGASYLNMEGLDPLNKSLYSASYLIPFTKYGE